MIKRILQLTSFLTLLMLFSINAFSQCGATSVGGTITSGGSGGASPHSVSATLSGSCATSGCTLEYMLRVHVNGAYFSSTASTSPNHTVSINGNATATVWSCVRAQGSPQWCETIIGSFPVTSTTCASATAAITGIDTATIGGNYVFSATGLVGTGWFYSWSANGGASPSIGSLNTFSTSWSTSGTKTVSLTAAKAGCTSAVLSKNIFVLSCSAPTISIAGAGTICTGGDDALTATTTGGSGTFSYQWEVSSNGTSGWTNTGTNSTTLATGTLTASRWYRVTVSQTGGCGPTTSAVAKVDVIADPVATTASPTTICSGGNHLLTSSVTGGTGRVSYMWQTNASGSWANIPGAATSTYTTPNLTSTTSYRLNITQGPSGCEDLSNETLVTVVADPTVSITGNGTICIGGNNTLTATAAGGTGTFSYQWEVSSNGLGSWTNTGTNSATLATGALTASRWYRVTVSQTGEGCGPTTSASAKVDVIADPVATITGAGTICSGGNLLLSSGVTGGSGTLSYLWQESSNGTSGWTTVGTTATLNTGALTANKWYRLRVIQTASGCRDWSPVVAVTVIADPTISLTGNGTVCTGGNDVLTATVTGGNGTNSYQWQISTNGTSGWVNTGTNLATLNTGALTSDTWYRLTLTQSTNGCGPNTSSPVKVTVVPDPIATITGAGTICSGGNMILTGSATGGSGTLSYLWQTNASGSWANIPGATSATYTTPNLTSTTSYRLRVTQTASGCLNWSTVAVVTVLDDPTVSLTGNGTICAGGSDVITATVSGGDGTNSYQWQISSNGTSGWVNTGNNSSTLNTGPLLTDKWYRVTVTQSTAGCGLKNTGPVKVTVVADPANSDVSVNSQTICIGGEVTLTASPTGGSPNMISQWQSSPNGSTAWSDVGTANSNTYTTSALSSTSYYRMTLTDPNEGCNDPASSVANITVLADPVASISGNGEICSGEDDDLTATVTGGDGNSTYQWQYSPTGSPAWTNVGTNSNTFNTGILTNTGSSNDIEYYRVLITQTTIGCSSNRGSATNAPVTVKPEVTASIILPSIIKIDTLLTFDATNAGTGATYAWDFGTNATPQFGSLKASQTEFSVIGTESVTLVVTTKDGCSNTDIANFNVAVPVTWGAVSLEEIEESIMVEWSTLTEVNNNYFTVERSADGQVYEPIGTVKGAGNSVEIRNYNLLDQQPLQGTSFYRIKQTDFDGMFDYSEVRVISLEGIGTLEIYPNPARSVLNVNSDIADGKVVTVSDMNGNIILSKNLDLNQAKTQLDVSTLRSGIYFISCGSQTKRLVILN